MAFSLNAILKFSSSQAEAALTRTKTKFDSLKTSVSKANEALNKASQVTKAGAAITAPFTIGLGFASKTAADFESQMSKVKAVTLASDSDMKKITATVKRLGATTQFTSVQAGEAAELLGQAGFSSTQIIGALPGVLNAAAASSVDMATAADIIASQLTAFGREASDAGKIADSLALTSALTNTNLVELGEAMKMTSAEAMNAGVSLEETASAIGVLSNAGIKGTLAGTAFKNSLLQLAKPSKDAIKLFGGKEGMSRALLETVNGVKKLRPMEVIMANAAIAIQGAKDPLEATAQAAEIFGIRGGTAFNAFRTNLQKTTEVTADNIDTLRKGLAKTGENINLQIGKSIPSLVALRLQIAGAEGTAKRMADIRMDNILGQWEQFTSAVEGVSLEIGTLVNVPLRQGLKQVTDFISVMAVAFQSVASGEKIADDVLRDFNDRQKSLIPPMMEFARGFIDGFNEVKAQVQQTIVAVSDFMRQFLGESGLTAKELGNIAAKFVLWGAIASPILIGITGGLLVMGPILSGLSSAVTLTTSLFSAFGTTASLTFTVLRLLGSSSLFIITKAFSVLAAVGGPALSLLRAGMVALATPIGIITLKILAIGALIAAAVLAVDALIRKMGFLKGPSLFEQSKGFLSGLKDKVFGGNETSEVQPSSSNLENILQPFKSQPGAQQDNLVPEFLQTGIESQKLSSESLKQKAIVSSPNEEILQALKRQSSTPQASGPQQVVMQGKLETKISGKDLNIILTRAMIDNSEANGRTIDPVTKRRALQNGLAFGVR